jgi:hypothetical protein
VSRRERLDVSQVESELAAVYRDLRATDVTVAEVKRHEAAIRALRACGELACRREDRAENRELVAAGASLEKTIVTAHGSRGGGVGAVRSTQAPEFIVPGKTNGAAA